MYGMIAVVVFLTLFGNNLPKDGTEVMPIVTMDNKLVTWNSKGECEAHKEALLPKLKADEIKLHGTDKFEIKLVCEPLGEPA